MATTYRQQYVYTSIGNVDYEFTITVTMRTGNDPDTGIPTNTIDVDHYDGVNTDYPGVPDSDILSQINSLYQAEINTIDNVPNRDLDTQLQEAGFTPNYNA